MSAISLSQYLSIRKNSLFATELIRALSEKYGFDCADAMNYLNVNECKKVGKKVSKKVEKKTKSLVPKILLPFCGVVNSSWCEGVRSNHNLFIQCTNERSGDLYCKTCEKQACANSTGKPTYGNINDRRLSDVTINKKRVSHYGNVMEILKISRDEAVLEASRFGWTIPEEQFAVKKIARGRAKKLVDLNEKKCEKVSCGRGRGRPKSSKKTVNSSAVNDLIGELVKKAKSRVEFDDESNSEVDEVTSLSGNGCVVEQLGSEVLCEVVSESVVEVSYEVADDALSEVSVAELPASISEPVTFAEVVTEKSKSSKVSKAELKAEKVAAKAQLKAEKAAAKALKKSQEKSQKKSVSKESKQKDTSVSVVASSVAEVVTEKSKSSKDAKAQLKAEKVAAKALKKSSKESKADAKAQLKAEKASAKAEKAAAKAEKAAAKALKKSSKECTKVQKKSVSKEAKKKDMSDVCVEEVSDVASEKSQEVSSSNSVDDSAEESTEESADDSADDSVEEAEEEAEEEVSAVVAEKSQMVSRSISKEVSEEEEDEEVEVEVSKWEHKGKKYLKSSKHKVYDIKTQEAIGIWNEEEDTIEEISEEEDDDDDDSD
jgi:hypothetical protein